MEIKKSIKNIKQGKLRETVVYENGKVKEYAYSITKNSNVVRKGGLLCLNERIRILKQT